MVVVQPIQRSVLRLAKSTLFPYTTLFRSPCLPGTTLSSAAQRSAQEKRGSQHNTSKEIPFFCRGCEMAVRNRSEEHTSELQSRPHLVCRLLLEKKNYHLVVYLGANLGL